VVLLTKRKRTDEEWKAMELAWTVAMHVKSNAIAEGLAALFEAMARLLRELSATR
jgi:AICAR transformylase/IMP cyclohydrolase PurH